MESRRNVSCHACSRKESQENYGETERSSIKQPSYSLRKTVNKVVFDWNLCIGIRALESFCMDQFKRTLECIFLSEISAQPEYSTSNEKRINS
jgi:hypothetical protein